MDALSDCLLRWTATSSHDTIAAMVTTDVDGIPMVIGHDWAVELLEHSVAIGHPAHAYLFAGPPRVGKTSLALYLARALNCLDPQNKPCGSCRACQKITKGIHPDVRVIDEPLVSVKIEQMRELQREMSLSPFEGRWRVYIVCGFEQATLEAANCLLKTLEEPPPKVILVLTAREADLLLPTIVSRCQVFRLRPLPTGEVEQALRIHWGVEARRARLLAKLSGGRLGWAVEASRADTLLRDREKYFVALEEALRQGRTGRMALAQQLSQNPQVLPELFDLWQSWWRDLLLAKMGNPGALTNIDREQAVLNEAQQYTVGDILSSVKAVQRAALHVEQNVNATLALEVLLLTLPASAGIAAG